jgi:hypothetical protein
LNCAELLRQFLTFPQTFPRLCAKLNQIEKLLHALRHGACYALGPFSSPSSLTRSIRR